MSPVFVALGLTNLLLLFLLVRLPVRAYWLTKVAAIVLVAATTFLAWSVVGNGKGWPTPDALPENAKFLACSVVEPSAMSVGVIYVWQVPLNEKNGRLEYRAKIGEPRAYATAYDRSLHEACVAATKASSQGTTAGIRRKGRPGRGGQQDARSARYEAYLLPSPNLPEKG